MLKLQLSMCVVSAVILMVIGRTMSSSAKTEQIDKDTFKSKVESSNKVVFVRSRPRLEFGMLFGSTCPSFLHGRYSNSQNGFEAESLNSHVAVFG